MIEVARQLFARVGFTNTTMNDIADASKKGRRTLYTYFRNKDEIFQAVIERELERLWHDMELIRRLPATPEEKILTMMLTHLDKIKDLVLRNGSLRAEFFRDAGLALPSMRRRSSSSRTCSKKVNASGTSRSPTLDSWLISCRISSKAWKSPSSVGPTEPREPSKRSVPPCVISYYTGSRVLSRAEEGIINNIRIHT